MLPSASRLFVTSIYGRFPDRGVRNTWFNSQNRDSSATKEFPSENALQGIRLKYSIVETRIGACAGVSARWFVPPVARRLKSTSTFRHSGRRGFPSRGRSTPECRARRAAQPQKDSARWPVCRLLRHTPSGETVVETARTRDAASGCRDTNLGQYACQDLSESSASASEYRCRNDR